MTVQSRKDQFIRWAAGEFYSKFRKDQKSALLEVTQKALALDPEERKILALTFANVAGGASEMGGFLGGGMLKIWIVAGIASAALYEFGLGSWAAAPLGLTLLMALRNRWVCQSRAEAYRELSVLLH